MEQCGASSSRELPCQIVESYLVNPIYNRFIRIEDGERLFSSISHITSIEAMCKRNFLN